MIRRADCEDVFILRDNNVEECAIVGSLEGSDPCICGDWRYRGHIRRSGRRDRRGGSDRGTASEQDKRENSDIPPKLEHRRSSFF